MVTKITQYIEGGRVFTGEIDDNEEIIYGALMVRDTTRRLEIWPRIRLAGAGCSEVTIRGAVQSIRTRGRVAEHREPLKRQTRLFVGDASLASITI